MGGVGTNLAAALGVVTLDLALDLGAAAAGPGIDTLGCAEADGERATAELDVERRLPVGEALLERGLRKNRQGWPELLQRAPSRPAPVNTRFAGSGQ